MKKYVLGLILGTSLIACKNDKDLKFENKNNAEDSLAIDSTQEVDSLGAHRELLELTPEKIPTLLSAKTNDTLYVTNFFATWCQPCMIEIPHFKEKMEQLKDQPVKFTFVSLDNKSDWPTQVSDFADEYGLRNNIVLLDGSLLTPEFFSQNFDTWNGEAIPFTLMRRGNMVDEYMGSMKKEEINAKIDKMMAANFTPNINEQKEKNKITGKK
ncbi:TlpA family protein disulfide reductase [Chryseobacterium sp. POL2]|uniref:TlpA family protein disulfide reductase n=1 Tax=Chryseobacterium sp. POL2 TaxID=2713414 RepID=UPI0013E1BDCC|nr:TlpA disulfide reductase family protein [Chryseobacterium sp. POL2]QIG88809.1 TlpA family protein disulfide reductase [Chryseobacterium sp. POL2]